MHSFTSHQPKRLKSALTGAPKSRPPLGLVYCMEFLESNLDWLAARLEPLEAEGAYFVFDCPGQVGWRRSAVEGARRLSAAAGSLAPLGGRRVAPPVSGPGPGRCRANAWVASTSRPRPRPRRAGRAVYPARQPQARAVDAGGARAPALCCPPGRLPPLHGACKVGRGAGGDFWPSIGLETAQQRSVVFVSVPYTASPWACEGGTPYTHGQSLTPPHPKTPPTPNRAILKLKP